MDNPHKPTEWINVSSRVSYLVLSSTCQCGDIDCAWTFSSFLDDPDTKLIRATPLGSVVNYNGRTARYPQDDFAANGFDATYPDALGMDDDDDDVDEELDLPDAVIVDLAAERDKRR